MIQSDLFGMVKWPPMIGDKKATLNHLVHNDPSSYSMSFSPLSQDISALGLRHVGYGIPTEFFAPFVHLGHDQNDMKTSENNMKNDLAKQVKA